MNKILFMLAFGISIFTSAYATVCPSFNDLNYKNGGITPPEGYRLSYQPTCPDNTPIGWGGTYWGTLATAPSRIQCIYSVKKNSPGCGYWAIVRKNSSVDPWLSASHPHWDDQGSHSGKYGPPWDNCEQGTGGTRTTCEFQPIMQTERRDRLYQGCFQAVNRITADL